MHITNGQALSERTRVSAARALCPYVAVRKAVCDELGLLEDEVLLECSLVDDYGADGEELVEILRAVEGSTGLLLDPAGLRGRLRGPLADHEFQDEAGSVTAAGLDHLARVIAGLDTRALAGRLPARRIMALVTIGDLVELVAAAAAARDGTEARAIAPVAIATPPHVSLPEA